MHLLMRWIYLHEGNRKYYYGFVSVCTFKYDKSYDFTIVPYIAVDMAGAILSVPAIQFGQYGNNALLIETEFGDERMINGYFILMPEEESYAKILSSLGIQL